MTIDEVVEIGRQALIEYENQLKVKGVRSFSHAATKLCRSEMCQLENIQLAESVRQYIDDFLSELSEVGSFVMSEPEYTTVDRSGLRNVSYNNLRMTFEHAMGFSNLKEISRLHISCHYYPD